MTLKFLSWFDSSEFLEYGFKRIRLSSSSSSEFDTKENLGSCWMQGGSNSEVKLNNSNNSNNFSSSNTNLKKRLIQQTSSKINHTEEQSVNKSNINQNSSELSTAMMSLGLGKRLKLDSFVSRPTPLALTSLSTLTKHDQKSSKSNQNHDYQPYNNSTQSQINFDKLVDCNYSELIDYWFPDRTIEDENFLS